MGAIHRLKSRKSALEEIRRILELDFIVIGAMADDQIYNHVSDYMDGSITREQFWVLAKFKYPTHQINFCTKEALNCLEYRGFEGVSEW